VRLDQSPSFELRRRAAAARVWVRADAPGGTLKLRFREYNGTVNVWEPDNLAHSQHLVAVGDGFLRPDGARLVDPRLQRVHLSYTRGHLLLR